MYVFNEEATALKFNKILKNIRILIFNQEFARELKERESFWNTEATGKEIFDVLKNCNKHSATLQFMGFKRFRFSYRNVVAETVGNVVSFNPKFLGMKEEEIANTLVHEWLHTRGYSHMYNNPYKYPIITKSVPYAVGDLVEKHYKRFFNA